MWAWGEGCSWEDLRGKAKPTEIRPVAVARVFRRCKHPDPASNKTFSEEEASAHKNRRLSGKRPEISVPLAATERFQAQTGRTAMAFPKSTKPRMPNSTARVAKANPTVAHQIRK